MRPSRVLILDGDSRQALPFARSLRQAGHHVTLICPWKSCPGYLSRYPNKRLIWPDINKEENRYYRVLLDYVKQGNCNILLALGDATAILVSKNRQELTQYVKTPVPDYNTLIKAADKSKTMAFCMENNIPCPKTYDPQIESVKEIISKASFPVIVKPVRGVGAVGLHKFASIDELTKNLPILQCKYGNLQVQEYIPQEGGTQFQAEAFCDEQSRMKVCMVIAKPRFFPVTGGTSTCNVTVDRPDIVENVRRLLEGIKWVGSADVDLILDPRDNTAKILEINPRVTAGIKIGFDAGIDYADLQMRLAMGLDIPQVTDYKMNVVLRNLCLDLLWYKYSGKSQRSCTQPRWWDFLGKDVHYQTLRWDDPLPLLGFILSNVKKYSNQDVWKSKLGRDVE